MKMFDQQLLWGGVGSILAIPYHGLGWVGLGWVRLGWVGSILAIPWVGLGWVVSGCIDENGPTSNSVLHLLPAITICLNKQLCVRRTTARCFFVSTIIVLIC